MAGNLARVVQYIPHHFSKKGSFYFLFLFLIPIYYDVFRKIILDFYFSSCYKKGRKICFYGIKYILYMFCHFWASPLTRCTKKQRYLSLL